MESYSNIGYNTYFRGFPNDLKECSNIYLYKQTQAIDEISLKNLEEVFETITTNPDKISPVFKSEKDLESGYFILNNPYEGNFIEFDVIIYCQSGWSSAIGYTIFNSVQSTEVTEGSFISIVKILLDFQIVDNNEVNVIVSDSLSEIYNNSGLFDRSDLSDNPDYGGDFSKPKDVINYIENSDNYIRYTNIIRNLIEDNSMSLITDSNIILGGNELKCYQLYIKDGVSLNDYKISYDNYSIGTYKGDVVVNKWYYDNNKFYYNITSLTNINKYGIPKIIFQGSIDSENLELDYISYCYAIFNNTRTNEKYLYNLETNSRIYVEEGLDFFVDPWDITGSIIKYDNNLDLSELANNNNYSEISKQLGSISLDIWSNLYKSMKIRRKIGSWFIFNRGDKLVYSNQNGTLILTPSNNKKIFPISSRCIMVEYIYSENEGIGRNFTFYFLDSGLILNEGDSGYQDYIYTINASGGMIGNILIDGLRKRPISSINLPGSESNNKTDGFIDSFYGILFYLSNNNGEIKLKYL